MVEIWKDIKGWEGLYQVSNYGNVKSIHYPMERILKPATNIKGYKQVVLCKNYKTKSKLVHRLVASAFIPNPNNYPVINHKDEVEGNNHIDNLEWCSHNYNVNYGGRTRRATKSNTNHPNMSKQVGQYDLNMNLINIYPSTNECGRQGFLQSLVHKCCSGERNTHGGFIWKYMEEDNYAE